MTTPLQPRVLSDCLGGSWKLAARWRMRHGGGAHRFRYLVLGQKCLPPSSGSAATCAASITLRSTTPCLNAERVHCAFVFDTAILTPPARADRRVEFIHASLVELDAALDAWRRAARWHGGGLIVRHAPRTRSRAWLGRAGNGSIRPPRLRTRRRSRDSRGRVTLAEDGIGYEDFKDQVVFERDEVLTQTASPTACSRLYKNAWLKAVDDFRSARMRWNYAARLAPKPAGEPCPRLATSASAPTNLAELNMPVGAGGGKRLFDDFAARIGATSRRATSRR